MVRLFCAALVATLLAGCGAHASDDQPAARPKPAATTPVTHAKALSDWPLFGLTAQRPNTTDRSTGVTAATVKRLKRTTIDLPGTVDSSAIALGATAYMTTTYGKTVAVSLTSGKVKWTYTPDGIDTWEGSAQITNATPAADPSHRFLFTASPDGRIHKLDARTGKELWSVSITKNAQREKITSSLNIDGNDVIATTGGYIGDAPPYQGHVVTISRAGGHIEAVWNSLCADQRKLIDPSSCKSSDSAIWGRSGAVVQPGGKGYLVTTGNAPFDGANDWGDSVLQLKPHTLDLTASWTPSTTQQLNQTDADLGSTSPALLGGGLYLQGGKDALLHLLDDGSLHQPSAKLGGELANVASPGKQMVFTTPAVWHHGGRTTVFVATGRGTTAYTLKHKRLVAAWSNDHAGTSPVLAGGLLYVFDPDGNGIRAYVPGSGRLVTTLPAGKGHWQSPIALHGAILEPEGNANDHAKTGTASLYR